MQSRWPHHHNVSIIHSLEYINALFLFLVHFPLLTGQKSLYWNTPPPNRLNPDMAFITSGTAAVHLYEPLIGSSITISRNRRDRSFSRRDFEDSPIERCAEGKLLILDRNRAR